MSDHNHEQPRLARDQNVGEKPEQTSNEDFQKFKEKRQIERRQIDLDENKSAWSVGLPQQEP